MGEENSIKQLLGEFVTKIENKSYELIFHCKSGNVYKMYHEQDCCEEVAIEEIIGNFDDLLDSKILQAEETTKKDSEYIMNLWTFYKLATIKGYVTIRWFGDANFHYSVDVDFIKIN